MKTNTFESVKSEVSINKCLEYSENKEELKNLLNDIDVKVKFTGIKKHFETDKEERLTGVFQIKRGEGIRSTIEFDFGFSLSDTEIFLPLPQSAKYKGKYYDGAMGASMQKSKDKKEFMDSLLYDCLTSCKSDFFISSDFDEFCSEFGYSNDSISAKNTWELCLKQSNKLKRIFNDSEIDCLPS